MVYYDCMKNLTDIRFIVDRSGSMSTIASAMKDGFSEFINKEVVRLKEIEAKNRKNKKKIVSEETKVSVYLFDDKFDTLFENKNVKEVGSLELIPRGMTALYDGIGKTMNSVGEQLAALPESERPNKVMIVIITDGHENASREFNFRKIQDMIKHQRETYSWEFVFLGANIDSFAVGGSLGIAQGSTRNYEANAKSVKEAWDSYSRGYGKLRADTSALYSAGLDTKCASFSFDDNTQGSDGSCQPTGNALSITIAGSPINKTIITKKLPTTSSLGTKKKSSSRVLSK